jgi:ABC-type bacteriocin/lantibiotic exporter with double-glycine peptidase domain
MIILSQKNPSWRWELIGKSYLHIGNYGCLIACLSMLSDWYGNYRDPKWMARNLSFTNGGLLLWLSITSSKLPMSFVYRYYKQDDRKIREILASKDNACILQVPFGGYTHWVVLIGYSKLKGYKIADPWDGKIKWLNTSYKKIIGFAEITRK